MSRGTNDTLAIDLSLESTPSRMRLVTRGVWAAAPAPWDHAAEDEAIDALWIDIGGSG